MFNLALRWYSQNFAVQSDIFWVIATRFRSLFQYMKLPSRCASSKHCSILLISWLQQFWTKWHQIMGWRKKNKYVENFPLWIGPP